MKAGCENITYNVGRTVVYGGGDHRASDKGPVTNQFDDVTAGVAVNPVPRRLRRHLPHSPPPGKTLRPAEAVAAELPGLRAADHEDPDAVMPATGDENGLSTHRYARPSLRRQVLGPVAGPAHRQDRPS